MMMGVWLGKTIPKQAFRPLLKVAMEFYLTKIFTD